MHRTSSYAALLGMVGALALAPGAAAQVKKAEQIKYPPLAEFKVPQPTRHVLDNGMVVILLEDHELPLVDVAVRIRTGARLEPADKVALASLAGNVMRTGGTRNMTGDELDDFLEGKAAFIETGIGTAFGSAGMGCLKDDLPEVLKVFYEVLRYPAFDEEKLKVARNQVVAGIARQNDNPQGILFREFAEIIYGADSPYARTATYETVDAIDRGDLVGWHRRYYHPNRIILGAAGDFRSEEVLALIREVFADWPRGPEAADAEASYNREVDPGVYFVEKTDMNQSNVLMGHLGIRKDNPDYYAVEVMNQVLSGSFASRLFSNVRSKKGLAYAVSGGVGSDFDHHGTFSLFMTTKTETTAAGIDALLEEARDLTARPPTDEEVEKAKAAILNSFIFNSDSTLEILNQQINYEYYGYPLDWLQRYRTGIEKVTTAQVKEAAARHVNPDRMAILVVGPAEGRDRPLSEFGKVTEVDITIPEPEGARVAASPESLARGRELVALALKGMGGAERVDAVKAMGHKGSMAMKTPQGEMEVRFTTTFALPDRMHQELSLPFGTMTMVVTPDDGFVRSPQGVQSLPAEQRDRALKDMRRDLVVLLQTRGEEGFEAVAVGSGEAAGIKVEKLQVTFTGDTTTLGIDPQSGRVVMLAFQGNHPMTQAPGEVVRILSDFREVDGVVFPFAIESTFDGEPSLSATLESLQINPPVEETAFAKPAEATALGGGGRQ